MCNVSEYIFETAMKEGMEKGMELSVCIFKILYQNPGKSVEKVAEEAGCKVQDVETVKKMFNI